MGWNNVLFTIPHLYTRADGRSMRQALPPPSGRWCSSSLGARDRRHTWTRPWRQCFHFRAITTTKKNKKRENKRFFRVQQFSPCLYKAHKLGLPEVVAHAPAVLRLPGVWAVIGHLLHTAFIHCGRRKEAVRQALLQTIIVHYFFSFFSLPLLKLKKKKKQTNKDNKKTKKRTACHVTKACHEHGFKVTAFLMTFRKHGQY